MSQRQKQERLRKSSKCINNNIWLYSCAENTSVRRIFEKGARKFENKEDQKKKVFTQN